MVDKNTQDFLNAGSDILRSVTKAIDTNDYSSLASEISETVKSISYERRTTYASSAQQRTASGNVVRQRAADIFKYPFLAKRISRYDGVLSALFGTSLGAFMLMVSLGCLFGAPIYVTITMFAITAICGLFSFNGFKKLKLSKVFYKYGKILKNAEYFNISDLAKAAFESDEDVHKNLKAMVKAGYLPRGKFDSSETTFMITDAAYQMYLGAVQDRLAREQRQAKEDEVLNQNRATTTTDKSQSILDEGREYIRFVRQINDIIPDSEVMSSKLYRLENIMNKIFEQVKKDPSSADDLYKLMNYYLPTTKKLLSAYVELDKQAGNGENVQQTKQEIDAVMDTINEAFEKLLDSMFQDMAWDISSDISVMKTMMAQDGLTSDGMAATATATASAGAMATAQEGITLEFGNK